MAGFWRPRRQAGTRRQSGGEDDAGVIAVPGAADDPELAAQIAHLEEIERRYAEAAEAEGDSREGVQVTMPEVAWPEAIPPVPDAAAPDAPDALLRWLDTALAVLSARAARNRDELQRLTSQWVHISRNLDRFRPDEVAAVHESEAQVRERVAGDETTCHLIRLLRGHLAARAGEPAGAAAAPLAAAEVAMLRSLLDSAAADRARAAADAARAVLQALSGLALDIEVVRRQAEREPEGVVEAVRGLQDRVIGVIEDLRDRPGTELVTLGDGEALPAALRRCLDAYGQRADGDLVWSGGEPADPEVAGAVLWVVQEFLAGVWAGGGREMRVALAGGVEEVVLRLTAVAPAEAFEAGWVLRCRARAAVAGGTLAVEAVAGTEAAAVADAAETAARANLATRAVEVRFPGAMAAASSPSAPGSDPLD